MVNKMKGNGDSGLRVDQPSGFKTHQQIESVAGGFVTLGTRDQLPSGSMLSTWRVLKQFAHLLPSR